MSQRVQKPLVLDDDGIISELLNGAIVNIGGTSNLTFTVGGKPLLFADGTPTSGDVQVLDLQTIFDNTPAINGEVKLELGSKSLSFGNGVSRYFKINADTGKVTIDGDLEVLGSSTKFETIVTDSDHWSITPNNRNTIALKIEPDSGIVPTADLVSISKLFGQSAVFRLDANGNLFVNGSLTIDQPINGVDVAQVKTDLLAHLNNQLNKHSASQISINPINKFPGAQEVQTTFEAVAQLITQLQYDVSQSTAGKGDVIIYEYTTNVQQTQWVINHNGGTFRAAVAVYDENWYQIHPDQVLITSNNQIQVFFATPTKGRAFVYLSNVAGNIDQGLPTVAAPIGADRLDELSDTQISNIIEHQFLVFENSKWKNKTVSFTLQSLTDVDLTGLTANDILQYDGEKWVVARMSTTLSELGDVQITNLQTNQTLSYNGTKWVNKTIINDLITVNVW